MSGLVLKNNAKGLLQAAIIAGATSVTLQAGHTMPALAANEYCYLTFISTTNTIEVVRATVVAGNVLTISPTVNGYSAGDRLELRPCKEMLIALQEEASRGFFVDAAGTNTYTATLAPVPLGYITDMLYGARIVNANTGAATINFNGLGAATILKNGGAALTGGEMPAGHPALFLYDGAHMVLLNAATGTVAAPYRNWFVDGQIQASKVGPVPNLSASPQYGASLMIAGWASGGAISAGTLTLDTAATIGSVSRAVQAAAFTTTGAGVLSFRQRIHSSRAIQLKNRTVSFAVTALQDTGGAINFTVVIRKPTAKDNYAGVTVIGTSGATSVPTATATPVPYNALALGDCSFGLEIEVQAAVGAVVGKNVRLSDFVLDLETAVSNWAQQSREEADREVGFYVNSTFPDAVAPAQNAGQAGAYQMPNINLGNMLPGDYQWQYPMLGTPTLTTYNPGAANANWRDITAGADRTWIAPADLNNRHVAMGNTTTAASDVICIHFLADCRL